MRYTPHNKKQQSRAWKTNSKSIRAHITKQKHIQIQHFKENDNCVNNLSQTIQGSLSSLGTEGLSTFLACIFKNYSAIGYRVSKFLNLDTRNYWQYLQLHCHLATPACQLLNEFWLDSGICYSPHPDTVNENK